MRLLDQAQQAASLVVCLLVVASLAVVRHGELLGHEFGAKAAMRAAVDNDTLRTLADGTMVVNTTKLGADIVGYAGPVPLEISVKDGVVADVRALDNAETKGFFDQAATLLGKWRGKPLDEAASMEVDAVSGATFSSKAIIGNVRRGLGYAQTAMGGAGKAAGGGAEAWTEAIDLSAKGVAGLVVALMAAVLPLFVKNRVYRTCQLALNVIVLGFWCGAFLSYTSLLGYAAHGLKSLTLVAAVMLATAFVYPLFGRRLHYCTHVCPFGSLQQLAGKCGARKLRLGQRAVRRLDLLRQLVWALLMLCVWGGVWADWMDYEAFAAFIFQSASWVAVAIAAVFLLLSFVVARPYCRFVCPMGTLIAMSQSRGDRKPRK